MTRVDEWATSMAPRYVKYPEGGPSATQWWYIICDEGWRQSIVCEHMYEWAADWLLEVLGTRPFAPGHRP